MSERAVRTGEPLDYQSYLLRLWRTKEGEEGWRATLESAQTGQREGFATLGALFDYIRSQTLVALSEFSRGEGDARDGR